MRAIAMRIGLALTILASLFSIIAPVSAAHGVPGSSDFGIGVILDPRVAYSSDGIRLAGSLDADWIAITFDWKSIQPAADQAVNYAVLDVLMLTALSHNQPVMLSITNPPDFARSAGGPDISAVTSLVVALGQRYAGVLQAVELFPAANTTASWTAQPDPTAYAQLFVSVQSALEANQLSLFLIAGGLQPLNNPSAGDMDDLAFLQGLYTAGASQWMPILSLALTNLSGETLTPPSEANRQVLRHYEEIRQVMLNNQHASGLLWVTRVNAPSGTINPASSTANIRSRWYSDALTQLRSQLYIGVVFAAQLNPAPNQPDALILADGSFGDYYSTFRSIVQQNNLLSANSKPGQSKSNALNKIRK